MNTKQLLLLAGSLIMLSSCSNKPNPELDSREKLKEIEMSFNKLTQIFGLKYSTKVQEEMNESLNILSSAVQLYFNLEKKKLVNEGDRSPFQNELFDLYKYSLELSKVNPKDLVEKDANEINEKLKKSVAAISNLANAESTARDSKSDNIVKNGSFQDGTKYWTLHQEQGATARMSTRVTGAEFKLTNSAGTPESIQFLQNLRLIQGKKYRLSFIASSTDPSLMQVKIYDVKDFRDTIDDQFGSDLEQLSNEFSYEFRSISNLPSKLTFYLGSFKEGSIITIGRVELLELAE